MKLQTLGLLVAGLFAASVPTNATTLISQPPDQSYGVNMSFSNVAEDFTLAATSTITGLRFWAIMSAASEYSGSVSWAIYSNNAGAPGAVNSSGIASASAVATGLSTGFGYDEFVFDIVLTATLGPGVYWLSLHNGPLSQTNALEMLWGTTASGNGSYALYDDLTDLPDLGWISTGSDLAFEIYVDGGPTPVPEPGTWILVLGGLIAVRLSGRNPASKKH